MTTPERDYYCSACGRWLCAVTGPLGIQTTVRLKCGERSCGKQQSPHIGEPPLPRIDRDAWVARSRALRRAAHNLVGEPAAGLV
jgi:hypothetical protein